MFKHIVLFKSKNSKAVEKICKHVMCIQHEIYGLLEVNYIKNLTNNAKGFNDMAVMDFKNREDFVNWRKHPYHEQALNELKEIAEIIFFDYEY